MEGLSDEQLCQMLRFANAAAYLVTTKKGAIRSMPEKDQVAEILAMETGLEHRWSSRPSA